MLPLLMLINATIASVIILGLSLAEADDLRILVVFLAGISQAFLVYRENVGQVRRGYWADKGCAYFGLFWLFGAYCRRYRWLALPRFLLVLMVSMLGQVMWQGAASL